ncbi:hypothetical protein [Cylindrospermum sp. FACHB-282]|uniref:hypothetical protein n=1 Tax=Cylindrospermum sp. FACHB-282 TaxID=2692794 RepID=UPI00168852F6|nr:hypothetical protein [Cylindrospermum sp. FACHB-282]MBD2384904.1 hypothetical protein [Cylindrospermum sp. FACHB-282]
MKKMIIAFLMMLSLFFSLGQEQALAEECITTMNQGAATVAIGLYEQSCATLSFSSGVITKDVKYNCCGPSVTIRINGNDWTNLIGQGKLDGFRYQKIDHNNSTYSLTFRKVVGTTPQTIAGEDFFK